MGKSRHSANAGVPVPKPYPYQDLPVFPAKSAAGPAEMPLHACMGLNGCSGSDRFGLAGPPGGSPNACAGQGWCATGADHSCHVQNDCRNQGGCGLYGNGEEMNQPGSNECRSLGSCGTPINAERFSANGPNRGKSVWVRAREVFEQTTWPELRPKLLERQAKGEIAADQPLPETLGLPPRPFAGTGPTALWLTDNNKDGDNMHNCGSSGMSGP